MQSLASLQAYKKRMVKLFLDEKNDSEEPGGARGRESVSGESPPRKSNIRDEIRIAEKSNDQSSEPKLPSPSADPLPVPVPSSSPSPSPDLECPPVLILPHQPDRSPLMVKIKTKNHHQCKHCNLQFYTSQALVKHKKTHAHKIERLIKKHMSITKRLHQALISSAQAHNQDQDFDQPQSQSQSQSLESSPPHTNLVSSPADELGPSTCPDAGGATSYRLTGGLQLQKQPGPVSVPPRPPGSSPPVFPPIIKPNCNLIRSPAVDYPPDQLPDRSPFTNSPMASGSGGRGAGYEESSKLLSTGLNSQLVAAGGNGIPVQQTHLFDAAGHVPAPANVSSARSSSMATGELTLGDLPSVGLPPCSPADMGPDGQKVPDINAPNSFHGIRNSSDIGVAGSPSGTDTRSYYSQPAVRAQSQGLSSCFNNGVNAGVTIEDISQVEEYSANEGTNRDGIGTHIGGRTERATSPKRPQGKQAGYSTSPKHNGERIWRDFKSGYLQILSYGSFATCGRRETTMETHSLRPRLFGDNVHLFGIFHGHRGAAAAEFSARAFPEFLQRFSDGSPVEALARAFTQTDLAFRKLLDSSCKSKGPIQKDWHPGCTAIVVLLVKEKLYVANAGDCRTILCRKGHAVALSRDHVASCPKERERVILAGGQVKFQVDDWRVGSAAIQVTRSIGDDDLKPAVTAEPEIIETNLSSEDEFLVMASDGLWAVVSNEEVVRIIRDMNVKDSGMCAKRLATEAAKRGSKDNIKVIVVFLFQIPTGSSDLPS